MVKGKSDLCIVAQVEYRFINAQAFLQSYDSAPCSPPPPPTSTDSKLDWRHPERLRKRDNLLKGWGVGVEPSHTTARKPDPLKIIQNSLVGSLVRTWGFAACTLKNDTCSRCVRVHTKYARMPRTVI